MYVVAVEGAVMVLGFAVGPSAQAEKTNCVPPVPACGVANETIQDEPEVHGCVEGVVPPVPQPVPVTVKESPVGEEVIVTPAVVAAKFAVTDCGALIVTVVEALLAEATGPVQLEN